MENPAPVEQWLEGHKPLVGGLTLMLVGVFIVSVTPAGSWLWVHLLEPKPVLAANPAMLALGGGVTGSLANYWLTALLDRKRTLESEARVLTSVLNEISALNLKIMWSNRGNAATWTPTADQQGNYQMPILKLHTSEAFKAAFASGLLMYDLSDSGVISRLLTIYDYFSEINHLVSVVQLSLIRHGRGVPVDDLSKLYTGVLTVYEWVSPSINDIMETGPKQIANRKKRAKRMGSWAVVVGLGAAIFLWYVFGAALRS